MNVSADESPAPEGGLVSPGPTLALLAADFRVPVEFYRNGEADSSREIHFNVEELLRQVSSKDARISLTRLAELAPDIFRTDIAEAADIRLFFPWQKLGKWPPLMERLRGASTGTLTPPLDPQATGDDSSLPELPSDEGAVSAEPMDDEAGADEDSTQEGRSELLAALAQDRQAHRNAIEVIHQQLAAALRDRNQTRLELTARREQAENQIAAVERRLEVAFRKGKEREQKFMEAEKRVAELTTEIGLKTQEVVDSKAEAERLRRELESALAGAHEGKEREQRLQAALEAARAEVAAETAKQNEMLAARDAALGDLQTLRADLDAAPRERERPKTTAAVSEWQPFSDLCDNEAECLVEIDLPGVALEDVEVTFKEGTLTVRGERRLDDRNRKMAERPSCSFSRDFQLPDGVRLEQAKARLEEGVLRIRFPKSQPAA